MSIPTAQSLAQKLVLPLASADRHVAAAVDILIEHEYWLTNPQFVEHCVHLADDGGAYIQWGEALRLYNEAAFAYSSTTERASLTWPSHWAPNRYRFRFRSMGARNATMLAGAVIAALNPPEIPGGRG